MEIVVNCCLLVKDDSYVEGFYENNKEECLLDLIEDKIIKKNKDYGVWFYEIKGSMVKSLRLKDDFCVVYNIWVFCIFVLIVIFIEIIIILILMLVDNVIVWFLVEIDSEYGK